MKPDADMAEGVGLLRGLMGARVGGDSNINVNLVGGSSWMVWISGTCCMVMLAVALMGGMWLISDRAEIRAQLRERRDGENAIRAYINTGILKPQNNKDKSDAE